LLIEYQEIGKTVVEDDSERRTTCEPDQAWVSFPFIYIKEEEMVVEYFKLKGIHLDKILKEEVDMNKKHLFTITKEEEKRFCYVAHGSLGIMTSWQYNMSNWSEKCQQYKTGADDAKKKRMKRFHKM